MSDTGFSQQGDAGAVIPFTQQSNYKISWARELSNAFPLTFLFRLKMVSLVIGEKSYTPSAKKNQVGHFSLSNFVINILLLPFVPLFMVYKLCCAPKAYRTYQSLQKQSNNKGSGGSTEDRSNDPYANHWVDCMNYLFHRMSTALPSGDVVGKVTISIVICLPLIIAAFFTSFLWVPFISSRRLTLYENKTEHLTKQSIDGSGTNSSKSSRGQPAPPSSFIGQGMTVDQNLLTGIAESILEDGCCINKLASQFKLFTQNDDVVSQNCPEKTLRELFKKVYAKHCQEKMQTFVNSSVVIDKLNSFQEYWRNFKDEHMSSDVERNVFGWIENRFKEAFIEHCQEKTLTFAKDAFDGSDKLRSYQEYWLKFKDEHVISGVEPDFLDIMQKDLKRYYVQALEARFKTMDQAPLFEQKLKSFSSMKQIFLSACIDRDTSCVTDDKEINASVDSLVKPVYVAALGKKLTGFKMTFSWQVDGKIRTLNEAVAKFKEDHLEEDAHEGKRIDDWFNKECKVIYEAEIKQKLDDFLEAKGFQSKSFDSFTKSFMAECFEDCSKVSSQTQKYIDQCLEDKYQSLVLNTIEDIASSYDKGTLSYENAMKSFQGAFSEDLKSSIAKSLRRSFEDRVEKVRQKNYRKLLLPFLKEHKPLTWQNVKSSSLYEQYIKDKHFKNYVERLSHEGWTLAKYEYKNSDNYSLGADNPIGDQLTPEEVTQGILSHLQYLPEDQQNQVVLLPFYGEAHDIELTLEKIKQSIQAGFIYVIPRRVGAHWTSIVVDTRTDSEICGIYHSNSMNGGLNREETQIWSEIWGKIASSLLPGHNHSEFHLNVQSKDNRCGDWTVWQTQILLQCLLDSKKPTKEYMQEAIRNHQSMDGFAPMDPIVAMRGVLSAPSHFIRKVMYYQHKKLYMDGCGMDAEDKVKLPHIHARLKTVARRLLNPTTTALAIQEIFALKSVGIDFTSAINKVNEKAIYDKSMGITDSDTDLVFHMAGTDEKKKLENFKDVLHTFSQDQISAQRGNTLFSLPEDKRGRFFGNLLNQDIKPIFEGTYEKNDVMGHYDILDKAMGLLRLFMNGKEAQIGNYSYTQLFRLARFELIQQSDEYKEYMDAYHKVTIGEYHLDNVEEWKEYFSHNPLLQEFVARALCRFKRAAIKIDSLSFSPLNSNALQSRRHQNRKPLLDVIECFDNIDALHRNVLSDNSDLSDEDRRKLTERLYSFDEIFLDGYRHAKKKFCQLLEDKISNRESWIGIYKETYQEYLKMSALSILEIPLNPDYQSDAGAAAAPQVQGSLMSAVASGAFQDQDSDSGNEGEPSAGVPSDVGVFNRNANGGSTKSTDSGQAGHEDDVDGTLGSSPATKGN